MQSVNFVINLGIWLWLLFHLRRMNKNIKTFTKRNNYNIKENNKIIIKENINVTYVPISQKLPFQIWGVYSIHKRDSFVSLAAIDENLNWHKCHKLNQTLRSFVCQFEIFSHSFGPKLIRILSSSITSSFNKFFFRLLEFQHIERNCPKIDLASIYNWHNWFKFPLEITRPDALNYTK